MISAVSLSRHYGVNQKILAVSDLNLQIERGERVAIVGRSGSGKSTLLNLLAGLDRPTSGRLTVDASDLHDLNRNEMAAYRLSTIGIIFQSFQLIPQRTALQNVELPLIIGGRKADERRQLAMDWLQRTGLEARSHHFPYELSGGEQQRVAIARALVNSPRVLLADEPTGNLDSATSNEIIRLLTELCEHSDVTFVLVTHDEPLAHRFGTRTLRMTDGTLSEE